MVETKIPLAPPHVVGPVVLIPHRKDRRKGCVLYLGRRRIVLSDCVFGVACESREHPEDLHSGIQRFGEELVGPAYSGTCAPYVTVQQLTECWRD